jgi:hypothetical protein
MKILVCVIGQLRHADITWPNFKKYVIDELGADFVTCGPDSKVQNNFTKYALDNFPSNQDHVRLNEQKCLNHRGAVYKYCKYLGIHDSYDQYILTRSDHMWTSPHPKLDTAHQWFMNSQFHFGISDRHQVMNKSGFAEYCENPGEFTIENYLYNKVNWGPSTALSPFPMYLTDAKGDYRYIDEKTPSQETLTWPFQFHHYEKGPSGSYSGRASR